MICPDCSAENPETNVYCDDCGAVLQPDRVTPDEEERDSSDPLEEEIPSLIEESEEEFQAPEGEEPREEKEPGDLEGKGQPVEIEEPVKIEVAEEIEEEIIEENVEEGGRPEALERDTIGSEVVPYFLSVKTGGRYELAELPAMVGRKSPAEAIVPVVDLTGEDSENYVSRRHGQVTEENGEYFYEDLKSSNGSLINNTFIEADELHPLKDGDLIRIGRTELLFRTQA